MNYSLTIRKEAVLDINSIFEYFENQRLGLGHDFLLCFEEGLLKIERNSLHYNFVNNSNLLALLSKVNVVSQLADNAECEISISDKSYGFLLAEITNSRKVL